MWMLLVVKEQGEGEKPRAFLAITKHHEGNDPNREALEYCAKAGVGLLGQVEFTLPPGSWKTLAVGGLLSLWEHSLLGAHRESRASYWVRAHSAEVIQLIARLTREGRIPPEEEDDQ